MWVDKRIALYMYAYIKGQIAECTPTHATIDAGGVGYLIYISLQTYSFLDQKKEALLYIHHIQREDVQALYGFATQEEKAIFGHLLSVSGVGPNTARVVLSSMTTDEVRTAIVHNDVQAFKRVKGVGPKTAQRILIDLKDKIGTDGVSPGQSQGPQNNTAYSEALSALIALGFPRTKASGALAKINKSQAGQGSAEELIKMALQALS